MKRLATKYLAWLATAGIALSLPLSARAFDGVIAVNVNLRAGPDIGYPAVTLLPAGMPVSIEGCIDGWAWCDVIAGPDRGWIAGTYLQEVYGGQPVFIADYGARIGIPIIAFSLGAYWDDYYRGRPWYGARSSWEHRHFAYRAPPRPGGFYRGGAYQGGGGYHGNTYRGGGNYGGMHGPAGHDYTHAAPQGNRSRGSVAHAMPNASRGPSAHAMPNAPRGPATRSMPNASRGPVAHTQRGPAMNAAHGAPSRPAGHRQQAPNRQRGDDRHGH